MQGYIWVFWDLAAVLLLLYFVWSGAAHGFLHVILNFMSYVAAVAVGNIFSPVLAELLYVHVVRDALYLVLMNRLEEFFAQGSAAAEIVEQIPQGLQRLMDEGVLEAAGARAQSAIQSEAGALVEQLIDAALREPVLSILQGIFFLLLFTLTLLVAKRIARLFTGVQRIPLIGTINTVLGGIVGVLQGALAIAVLALGVQLAILFTGGAFWMNPQVMDDTYIWRVFYNLLSL